MLKWLSEAEKSIRPEHGWFQEFILACSLAVVILPIIGAAYVIAIATFNYLGVR